MTKTVATLDDGSTDGWAHRIALRWNEALDAVLDVGSMLCEAKVSLPHGAFEELVDSKLPFGPRTARKLMVIHRDRRLLNPTYRRLLPSSWTTLYAITRLSNDTFQEAVRQKILRPDVERWEIENLRRSTGLPRSIIQNSDEDVQADWLPSFPSPDVRRWTVAQLRANTRVLQEILERVGNGSEIETIGNLVSDKELRRVYQGK